MKLHRRRKMSIAVPTTSMGDIAFLLIIFFMVCSNFIKEANIKYKPPVADELAAVANAPLSIVIDENATIFANGKTFPGASAVEALVEATVKDAATDEERMILFRCDQNVPKNVFEPVLEAITRGGGLLVAVGDKRSDK